MKKQKYLLPMLALALASAMWGVNTPLIKLGVETIPPEIFTAIRFLIVSLILLPFAIKTWKPIKRKVLLLFILSSVFGISLSSYTLNIGLSKTTAFDASIIWLMSPIVLFVLSAQFLKEKISYRTLTGILVALVGSIVIIGRPETSNMDNLVGNLLLVISVLTSAISIIICKPLMKKVSDAQATFLSMFPGIVPVAAYALTQADTWDIAATSMSSWQGLVFSTIIVTIANFLFYYGLRYKKAQDTGVYQYIDPAVAIVAAWFLLGERPTPSFTVGAVMVVLGVYIVERRIRLAKKLYYRKRF